MGGLSLPRDPVALDPERAEHHSERQVERLEDRALLDVQLEICRRVLELAARFEGSIEVDVELAQSVGESDAVLVPKPRSSS